MKEIKRIREIEEVIAYEANDGTQFGEKEECEKYEKTARAVIDEEGNLYSTYNPNSKWDWYEVGGRWTNSLTTKDARETNEDYVSEINWKELKNLTMKKENLKHG